MNLETKITIYKFTPQVFTLTPKQPCAVTEKNWYNRQMINVYLIVCDELLRHFCTSANPHIFTRFQFQLFYQSAYIRIPETDIFLLTSSL